MSGRCYGYNLNMLTAIDLFSGCGGLTLGLKQAGFAVIAAIEVDQLAAEAYRLNHPEVKLLEDDIRRVRPYSLMKQLGMRSGQLSLLAGCPPCQGFSSLRTLNGARRTDDDRNDLLFQFIRFVRAFRPKAVMMENVPGLAKDERFSRFCDQLMQLGYKNGKQAILDAADYGVPQRRKRLVIIAIRGKQVQFAAPIRPTKTVRDAIGGLPAPGTTGDELHIIVSKHSIRIQKLIELIPKDGGSRVDLPEEYWLACHKLNRGFYDVYGRMAWDSPAPTITGGCFNPSRGRFLHPQDDRAITLREAALLQGFPSEYKFPVRGSVAGIGLLIGNALPPALVQAQARGIAEKLVSLPLQGRKSDARFSAQPSA